MACSPYDDEDDVSEEAAENQGESDENTEEAKELFETEGVVDFVCFTDRYMVVLTRKNAALVYDLEQGMIAEEDKILQNFVRENTG